MHPIAAKPQTIKQWNQLAIRRTLKRKGVATKAEIAACIQTSTTTVRSLLAEMCENGEIESIGCGESSGGRRAQRYRLHPEKYYGVAFILTEPTIQYSVVNLYGEVVEDGCYPMPTGVLEPFLLDFLEEKMQHWEIRSVCVGVPGIAERDGYIRKKQDHVLEKTFLGEGIRSQYSIPVLLENDINAIAIGAGLSLSKISSEASPAPHLAFLYFAQECISAGFLSDGKPIRGWRHFAGELGFFPAGNGQTLCEKLRTQPDLQQYADAAASLVAQIGCIVNPQYVILGGPSFQKEAMEAIRSRLRDLLPETLVPSLRYSEDTWSAYRAGMAHLCAEQIFCDIEISGQGTMGQL